MEMGTDLKARQERGCETVPSWQETKSAGGQQLSNLLVVMATNLF